MARKFYLGINTVEDVTFLKVSGVIDEDNTLASTLKGIEGATVIIDLSGVERINSCGVRDWVNWLNDLERRGKQVVLARCSPCIVNQINLVNNFTGGGMVKSFFAPYYCPRCDVEQLKLLQVEAFAGMSQPTAPEFRGEGCNEVPCLMEFDDIGESYFAFIPRNTGQVVDPRLHRVIDQLSPSMKERVQRLDVVVQTKAEGSGTPVSSQYSPLTVTTGITIGGRDSISIAPGGPPSAEARERRARAMSAVLLGAAGALAALIIWYVVRFVGR